MKPSDSGWTITLTGGRAIGALALGVAVLIGRGVVLRGSLEDSGRQAIIAHLKGDYIRQAMAGVTVGTNPSADTAVGRAALRADSITLASVALHGFGSTVVARVEPRVAGGPPPDGRTVRYIRLKHSLVTGWMVWTDSDAVMYWLTLW